MFTWFFASPRYRSATKPGIFGRSSWEFSLEEEALSNNMRKSDKHGEFIQYRPTNNSSWDEITRTAIVINHEINPVIRTVFPQTVCPH
jgi:hypothetical protein